MEVIPLRQRALLAFDDQQTLAGEDEEPFLMVLAVVDRDRLTRPHHAEVEAELGEPLALLEVAVHAEPAGVVPLDVAHVPDEPAHVSWGLGAGRR